MTPFGSHKDRHERIGAGSIGIKAFENIMAQVIDYTEEYPYKNGIKALKTA